MNTTIQPEVTRGKKATVKCSNTECEAHSYCLRFDKEANHKFTVGYHLNEAPEFGAQFCNYYYPIEL